MKKLNADSLADLLRLVMVSEGETPTVQSS
jgi:hypothetical protein